MSEKLRLTFKLFWNFVIQPVREQKRNQIRQRNEEKNCGDLKEAGDMRTSKESPSLFLQFFLFLFTPLSVTPMYPQAKGYNSAAISVTFMEETLSPHCSQERTWKLQLCRKLKGETYNIQLNCK